MIYLLTYSTVSELLTTSAINASDIGLICVNIDTIPFHMSDDINVLQLYFIDRSDSIMSLSDNDMLTIVKFVRTMRVLCKTDIYIITNHSGLSNPERVKVEYVMSEILDIVYNIF